MGSSTTPNRKKITQRQRKGKKKKGDVPGEKKRVNSQKKEECSKKQGNERVGKKIPRKAESSAACPKKTPSDKTKNGAHAKIYRKKTKEKTKKKKTSQ